MSEKDTIEINSSTQEKINEKISEGQEKVNETIDNGKQKVDEKIDEHKDKFNDTMEKGQNFADRVASDLSKGVDGLFVNVKSAQKKLNNRVSDYKKSTTLDTNIIEDSENYYVKIETPGIQKEDIEIEAGDWSLDVKVEFPSFTDEIEVLEDHKVLLEEIKEGKCSKSITFSEQIDINDITATFNNGITIIILPKVKAPKQKVTVE